MQTRRMSLVETITSTAVGFVISWLLLWFLAAAFSWHNTAGRNTLVTILFTAASLLRGYCIRRLFNRQVSQAEPDALSAALSTATLCTDFEQYLNESIQAVRSNSAREEAETPRENSQAALITETLKRDGPSPVPFGEPSQP